VEHHVRGAFPVLLTATRTASAPNRSPARPGPVWLPLPVPAGGQGRRAGLEQALPDPWQDYRERRPRERRQAADREQALRDADPDDEPGTVREEFR
jgi:hypothetical protein